MTQLLLARRRAEEFARVIDAGGRHHDPTLDICIRLVDALRATPPVTMDEGFRSDLRLQLMTAAKDELGQPQAGALRPAGWSTEARARSHRRLAAAASALILVGGTTGVAAASEQALPGDMLYPVKRAVEGVELQFATTAYAHGSELLDQATTRLEEVAGLVARGPSDPGQPQEIQSALTDFSGAAAAGGQELIEVYRDSADPAAIGKLRAFTTAAASSLTELGPATPAIATDAFTAAAATVASLDATALAVCPTCASSIPPVQLPTTLVAFDFASPGQSASLRTLDSLSPRMQTTPVRQHFGDKPDRSNPHQEKSNPHQGVNGPPGDHAQPSTRPRPQAVVQSPQASPTAVGPDLPSAAAPTAGAYVPSQPAPTAGGPYVPSAPAPTAGAPDVPSAPAPTAAGPDVPSPVAPTAPVTIAPPPTTGDNDGVDDVPTPVLPTTLSDPPSPTLPPTSPTVDGVLPTPSPDDLLPTNPLPGSDLLDSSPADDGQVGSLGTEQQALLPTPTAP